MPFSMKLTWLVLLIAAIAVSAFKGVDAFPEPGSHDDVGLNREDEELASANKSEEPNEMAPNEIYGLLATCTDNEITCLSGECVNLNAKCDGYNDCADGSDEVDCSANDDGCSESEMACKSGLCVIATSRCDGVVDCNDGSDEAGCDASIAKASVIHEDRLNNQPCPIQKRLEKQRNETISIPMQSHTRRHECDVYGELIALRLCKLDEASRNTVMNEIDNTLYRAIRDFLLRQSQQ